VQGRETPSPVLSILPKGVWREQTPCKKVMRNVRGIYERND